MGDSGPGDIRNSCWSVLIRQQFWRKERIANTMPERSKSALTVLKTEDLIAPYVEIEDRPIYTFNYILGFSGGKK